MNDPYDLEAIPRPRGGNIARSKAATEKLRLMPDDAEIAAAERRGEQRILREIAKLPMPYGYSAKEHQRFDCDWCKTVWHGPGSRTDNPHPDNGCLWPRAQQAAQAKE